MKVICSKDNLLQGTQIAQRCVSPRAPLPILNGILLSASNNGLIFQATDLDLAIECTLPAEVMTEGTVVVPARHFSDIVRRLPDQNITLDYEPEHRLLTLTYGSAQFNIHTLNAEEFPLLPARPDTPTLEIDQITFKDMIRQVAFAAATDPIRPIFTGVLLEIAPDYLMLVATDTHRLAKNKLVKPNTGFCEISRTIIPARALNELNRLLKEEQSSLSIALSSSQIVLYTEEFLFYSKPIKGIFPDHQKVIPPKIQTKLSVTIADLLPAIERASLLISTKDGNSIVHLSIKQHCLTINSNSVNLGSVHEEIPVNVEGQELEISFNARYLLDALKIINAEQISIEFAGHLSPCVIRPVSEEDYLYLLLPIRT
ncbi:MAG: DNA polymerase III subunit beta [Bacillota bacterium]|jgi:DNA polymerase-3 subunit beta